MFLTKIMSDKSFNLIMDLTHFGSVPCFILVVCLLFHILYIRRHINQKQTSDALNIGKLEKKILKNSRYPIMVPGVFYTLCIKDGPADECF